jgi:hypothetical protein
MTSLIFSLVFTPFTLYYDQTYMSAQLISYKAYYHPITIC